MWLTTVLYQLTGTFAGFLPTVRCLAAVALASCLFRYELFIWYTELLRKLKLKHRGLAPHNITPMLGVREPERRIRSNLNSTRNLAARLR
jgi:hypothetical protein